MLEVVLTQMVLTHEASEELKFTRSERRALVTRAQGEMENV